MHISTSIAIDNKADHESEGKGLVYKRIGRTKGREKTDN